MKQQERRTGARHTRCHSDEWPVPSWPLVGCPDWSWPKVRPVRRPRSSCRRPRTRNVGTILVSGKTVYTLKPSKTACSTACLKIWPALMLPKGVTKATAGKGVSASKLGTVKRSGGPSGDVCRQAALLLRR